MTKYKSEKMQMRHYEIIQSNKILEVVFVFSLSQQQQEQQQEQHQYQQREMENGKKKNNILKRQNIYYPRV